MKLLLNSRLLCKIVYFLFVGMRLCFYTMSVSLCFVRLSLPVRTKQVSLSVIQAPVVSHAHYFSDRNTNGYIQMLSPKPTRDNTPPYALPGGPLYANSQPTRAKTLPRGLYAISDVDPGNHGNSDPDQDVEYANEPTTPGKHYNQSELFIGIT